MEQMHRSRLALIVLAAALVVGCHRLTYEPKSLRVDGFRYRAGSAVVGNAADTLRVAVVAVNESRQYRELGRSACPQPNSVGAKVRKSEREWDSEIAEQRAMPVYRDSSRRPIPMACPAMLLLETFRPGASKTFLLLVPVREVLGDSLPHGRYRVTASVRINGHLERGLDAGDVVLSPPPI
jgi:hypothetical protein